MAVDRQQMRRIRRVARESLDFSSLHPGQEEAIQALLAGQDPLAVMPTGAGKRSRCCRPAR